MKKLVLLVLVFATAAEAGVRRYQRRPPSGTTYAQRAPIDYMADTFAELSAVTDAANGDSGFAIDTGNLYKRDGGSWVEVGFDVTITLAGDVDGASNANDLDEAAVEGELEGVLDLLDLQDGSSIPCTGSQVVRRNVGDSAWECATISGGGAPTDAEYLVTEGHASLSAEVAPAADDQVPTSDSATSGSWKTLPTGAVRYDTAGNTFSQAGVSHLAASSSADLRGVLSDEVGTGAAMFGIHPSAADDIPCTGSQVLRRNAGDTLWECATISAGSGNFVEASITLDTAGFYSTTVAAAWVTGASVIVCSPFGTTADGGTPELTTVAELQATVANRSAGVSFDLMVYNPHGASGTYRFHCSGV